MSERLPQRLLAGQIGKPHGLDGEVYVVPISDDPRRFQVGSRLRDAKDSVLEIESVRNHGTRMLVRFVGVNTRDVADTLRGPLYVPREDVRELESDEYWPQDLIGCEVFVEDKPEGRVIDVRPGSAHDLLVIETERGERMIPFVRAIVRSLDVPRSRIDVEPPQGLLD